MDAQELALYSDAATNHLISNMLTVGAAGPWLATVAHDVIVAAGPALAGKADELGYQFRKAYWLLCLEKGHPPA